MLSAIAGAVAKQLAGSLFDSVAGIFQSFNDKEISRDRAITRLSIALVQSMAEVEKTEAKTIESTWSSFVGLAKQSLMVRIVWASVMVSQLVVILWHQIGIPYFVYVTGTAYPSSGTTVEWAYALLFGGLGMGAVAFRAAPTGRGNAFNILQLIPRMFKR